MPDDAVLSNNSGMNITKEDNTHSDGDVSDRSSSTIVTLFKPVVEPAVVLLHCDQHRRYRENSTYFVFFD